jgi:hypothetical protein
MAISAHHSAHLGPLEHALDERSKGDHDGGCVVHQAPPARFLDQQARGTRRVPTPDEGGHHMQSEAIRHSPRLDTCEVAAAIRAHQESFVADQGSSGLIRSHQESSGVIRSHSWPIRVITCTRVLIRAHQGSSGLIRAHQGSSGLIRAHQGSSGLIRAPQGSPPREERRRDAREA